MRRRTRIAFGISDHFIGQLGDQLQLFCVERRKFFREILNTRQDPVWNHQKIP